MALWCSSRSRLKVVSRSFNFSWRPSSVCLWIPLTDICSISALHAQSEISESMIIQFIQHHHQCQLRLSRHYATMSMTDSTPEDVWNESIRDMSKLAKPALPIGGPLIITKLPVFCSLSMNSSHHWFCFFSHKILSHHQFLECTCLVKSRDLTTVWPWLTVLCQPHPAVFSIRQSEHP